MHLSRHSRIELQFTVEALTPFSPVAFRLHADRRGKSQNFSDFHNGPQVAVEIEELRLIASNYNFLSEHLLVVEPNLNNFNRDGQISCSVVVGEDCNDCK